MSKQIWLAPILSNNREKLLERASQVLRSGEGLLYLAASRPLLEFAVDRLLDGKVTVGVWGSLPVLLFRGFARHILATAVDPNGSTLPPRIPIDQDGLPLKRTLLSQILKKLAREGRLPAIGTLAHRDGCINTVASVIGEIQRAGKVPAEFSEIIEARAREFYPAESNLSGTEPEDPNEAAARQIPRQIDFDREIAQIYSNYAATIDASGFTEDDADQLRALEVVRGEIDGKRVELPWLSQVRLLVLDGFFDFTPVQGEILRLLIPRTPEVIVNVSRDERNPEVFRPLLTTLDQLSSWAAFETISDPEATSVRGALSPLRERLFNPAQTKAISREAITASEVIHLECSNRDSEIRNIAKRIKQLVLINGHSLADSALVVRELASYAATITRIFDEESIPCSLRRRIDLSEVPSARAAVKLFELLIQISRDGPEALTAAKLADVIKSGYFRLPETELDALRARFMQKDYQLLSAQGYQRTPREATFGQWDVDELENVVAYVGGDQPLNRWLDRARRLTVRAPEADAEREKSDDDDETSQDEAGSDTVIEPRSERRLAVRLEPVEVPLPGSERRIKPAREIHPATIAWAALVVEHLGQMITALPREGEPKELSRALMRLLEQVRFTEQVRGFGKFSFAHSNSDKTSEPPGVTEQDLPAVTLDLRGLEGLRRALTAASRGIEVVERNGFEPQTAIRINLGSFLDEILRAVNAETLIMSGDEGGGLKVLEATDIRGLRFKTIFIAGLVEGGFPLRVSRDWIYPHEERERLKRYGLTLEDISPDTLLKEEHYFYQAACSATEQLVLTRPLVLDDGSETVASYYIEEVGRAIAPAHMQKDVVRNDYDGRQLFESSRTAELASLLIRQEERPRHRAQRGSNFPAETVARLIRVSRDNQWLTEAAMRRIAIERERGGPRFGNFDGVINDSRWLERLASRYDAQHDFSASELSLYGKCPFKFFAEKVLRLEPRGEAAVDLSALDTGSLLHEILRRFFLHYRNKSLIQIDRAELKAELNSVADEVFDAHQRAVPPLNRQVWLIDREMSKLLLEQVLEYELSVERKTRTRGVHPTFFELAFGMSNAAADAQSTDQRLRMYRTRDDQTDTLLLRGQIDRVDIAADKTAIAYDYKLSRGPKVDDMREGRALQLHIYLAALEQLFLPGNEIAGAGYYTMRGGGSRRNQGLYRVKKKDYTAIGPNTGSSLSDEDWKIVRAEMETRIWEFVDGLRTGHFPVDPSDPKTTCPYCDFSAVCRYEKFRIRGKER